MSNLKISVLFIISISLFACNEVKIEKIAFSKSPVDKAYLPLRPLIQKFDINTDSPTTITAEKGTKVFIPKDCFVDNQGRSIKGQIQIEIIEAFTLSDFITSGLTTLSDDKLLLSNGMLFIDAKSSGYSLEIKKGAELSVSMPTMADNTGFQMFTGNGTNWSVDSSMIEQDYLTPLPLNLLYPTGNEALIHCWTKDGTEPSKIVYYDTTVLSYTKSTFENTIIATKEFKDREWVLKRMIWNLSFFINEDYYTHKKDCRELKFNYDVWNIYLDNPNQSIQILDSLVKELYVDYYKTNKGNLNKLLNRINTHNRNHFSNWTDTTSLFSFKNMTFEEHYMSVLDDFPNTGKGKVKQLKDYGVNLNSKNAYKELIALNLSSKEIDKILQYNFKRQSYIQQLEKEKNAIESRKTISKMYETTVFSSNKLGWINCDMFYQDSNAGKAEILLANTSENKLDFIDFSLVIPDMNVKLTSFTRANDLYSFTKENGPYTKLPLGKDAIVVGVSFQNDSIFFASQSIKIEDGLKLHFNMEYIPKTSLKDSLQLVLEESI